MSLKLLAGDVILTIPLKRPVCLPRFSQSALCGLWTALWYGAAHVALFADKIVEQSMKDGIRTLDWKTFVTNECAVYRQFWIYVVRPKHISKKNQQSLLQIVREYSVKKIPYDWKHAFTMPLITTTPYAHPEPNNLSLGTVCSALVAWFLKQAGVDIGRRSSIAFTPGTFLHSRKFKIISRTLYSDGRVIAVRDS